MAQNKIFFHGAVPGKFNGWGDYVRALDAAGRAAGIMSVGGGGFGDIEACWNNGSIVPHVVGMRYMPPGGGQDVPPYGTDPRQAAANWWSWLYPLIGADVKRHKDKVWIVTGNELNKLQTDWLGRFYIELATLMHAEGFKLCAFNFAPGEPEPPHWETAGMLDYLRLCADRPQDTAVGLHEYSLQNDLQSTYPYHIGRFEALHAACDKHGIKRPSILITEWGWRQDTIPEPAVAMSQLPWAAALYASHANILGAGLWTLKEWQGDVDDRAQAMIPLIRDYTLTAVFPDPIPPDPPTPPTGECGQGDYKSVVWLIPQEVGGGYWGEIAVKAHNTYKRTITASDKNAVVMACDGNHESYVVVWESQYASQQAAMAMLEAAGITYQLDYLSGNPPAAFAFTHWPTNNRTVTQEFGANPEDYAQYGLPGHEGVDIRAARSSPIYAVAGGTVHSIYTSPTGHNYGKHVRIDHTDGWQTIYAHLESIGAGIVPGAAVVGGQQIGKADNTGNSWGDHLHLTLKRMGHTYTDAAGNVWPNNIHDPTSFLATFGGVSWPGGSPGIPPEPPPGQQYDLSQYLFGKRDGRALQLSSGETVQYQEAGGWIYCIKNSQWEQFRMDGSSIWRAKDTSPGPAPDYAERPGQLRYYWQTETGQNAARWCPRYMTVGQVWSGTGHYVQYYYKSDCAKSAANTGGATNRATLIAHHPTKTWGGLTVNDVLEFKGVGDEHFWLIKDWGMGGWSAPWGESRVIELFQPGQRTLTRESGCFG